MRAKKILLTAAVIAWMAVIFGFSAQSGQSSGGFSERLILSAAKLIGLDSVPAATLDILQTAVRKGAHFLSYAVLALLSFPAVASYGVKGRLRYLLSLGICFLYAVSDEVHQMFIPGRNGNPIDVLIDTAGAAFGLLIIAVLLKLNKKTR